MNDKFIYWIIFFCAISLLPYSCSGQNKVIYKKIDFHRVYRYPTSNIMNQSKDITSYLPKGYNREGKTDYTDFIQKGFNENRIVLLPDFPVLINKKGIEISSNSIIIFRENSELIMSPNAEKMYTILNVLKKENIIIYNPALNGDRGQHLGNDGEWGMGININGSRKVSIYNPYIKNNWGDGIYIGIREGGENHNITISGGLLDYNRRNGISVISANNLKIENVTISNTFGTLPMAGIDIEPNDMHSNLENLIFENIKIINSLSGFQISLNYYGSKNISKNASINVNKLEVRDVTNGFFITGFNNKPVFKQMQGFISLNGYNSYDARRPLHLQKHFGVLPRISMKNYNFYYNGKLVKNKEKLLKTFIGDFSRFNYHEF